MTTLSRRNILVRTAALLASAPVMMPYTARGATRKIKLGHTNSPDSGFQAASLAFKKFLVEKSEGRIDVDIFPSAQLGSDVAMTKAVAAGTLDATVCGAGSLSEFNPDYALIELPFLFLTLEAARKAMDGKLADYLADTVKDKGIVTLALAESGFRHVTANKPVRTPADLKGVKIRVPPSKILLTTFNGLGAVASVIPFSNLPEALRTGVVEATDNSLSFIVGNEFLMKQQTHVSLTGHVYSPGPLIFSADAFDEFSGPDKALLKAAAAVFSKTTRDFADVANATGVEKIKAAGMAVVTDVDVPAFVKATEGINTQLAAISSADSIARIRGLALS